MTQLTLLLLVDAFRHDYVTRTSHIRRLAGLSRTGALREDFGFVPRAAYFGGLTPAQAGFTNMYCCDPVASPFGLARGLPSSRLGRDVENAFGIRTWLEDQARARVTPFAASYLSTAEIPLDLLPYFDLAEKRAPWDPHVGYRSVFHELDERAVPYFTCAWPDTNRLPDSSDRAIVAETLARVRAPMAFAFVHLQELDGIGHAYGPESAQLNAALAATDSLVDTLVTGLRRRFDRVNVILFGDHGMVSVTGTADVWGAIEAAGLTPGRDLVFFLDSTMARFWLPTDCARSRLLEALAPLPGRVLDDAALDRLDLRGCDSRNGEVIFLAHPGVLILPNFFQRRGHPVRGMHGYEPDCPDNQGFLLVHEHGDAAHGDLGTHGPTFIYREARRLLGLSAPAIASATRLPSPRLPQPEVFTQHPDPAANDMVAGQLTRVVAELLSIVRDMSAVVLTGSFGRGEGGVTRGADGRLRPVNDYDVLVISPTAADTHSAALRDLGTRLAADFDTDFVHFSVWRNLDPLHAPTIANFDVLHGSHILWGSPHVLDPVPRMAAASLPLFEGVQLLFNRLAGLLTGWNHAGSETGPSLRYRTNQTMKALMAIGDWHLLRAGAYDASYRTRLQRFSWLAPGLALPSESCELVQKAYRYKLQPDSVVLDCDATRLLVVDWILHTAIEAVGCISGRRVATPVEAAAVYDEITSTDDALVRTDNDFARHTLAGDALIEVRDRPAGSVRQAIYSSIPLLAASSLGDEAAFSAATSRLATCLTPPWPSALTVENLDLVRTRLAHAWLTLVH